MSRVHVEVGDPHSTSWTRSIICDRCGAAITRTPDVPSHSPLYQTESFDRDEGKGWLSFDALHSNFIEDEPPPPYDLCPACAHVALDLLRDVLSLKEPTRETVRVEPHEWRNTARMAHDLMTQALTVGQLPGYPDDWLRLRAIMNDPAWHGISTGDRQLLPVEILRNPALCDVVRRWDEERLQLRQSKIRARVDRLLGRDR